MATFPFVANMRLNIEDPSLIPAGQAVSQIANHSGGSVADNVSGGWGWITPSTGTVDGSLILSSTQWALVFVTATSGAAFFYSEPAPVTAGSSYSAGWTASNDLSTFWYRATVQWLDSAGAVTSSSATAVLAGLSGAQTLNSLTVPSGAVQARLRFDVYGTSGGANPTSALSAALYNVRMGPVSSAANLLTDPLYTNILGPSTSITIEREVLNVGTLTATIPDAAYDPAATGLLRPGRRVRMDVINPLGGGRALLFVGQIDTAGTTYNPLRKVAGERALVTMVATDNTTRLANAVRPDGYASLDGLRATLEGAGVPWHINGSTSQIATPAAITRNESASALDQVAIARDSVHGHAWMSRDGTLFVQDPAHLAATGSASLTHNDYTSALDASFDIERCINIVTIKLLRKNLATGETVEVPYGPYREQASINQWGPRAAEFTIQGLTDSSAAMQTFADEVFAANATPVKRINGLTILITTTSQINSRALIDLYWSVRVTNPNGFDQTAPVTKLTHRITPKGWWLDLSFGAAGGMAQPTVTPPVQNSSGSGVLNPGPQGGSTTVNVTTTGVNVAQAVTFPEPYPVAPTVVISKVAGNPANWDIGVTSVTTTGFNANVTRRAGAVAAVSVNWVAV